jgi:hypothetical protein
MLEIILFIIGLVGLIGGNLTVSKRSPIKGRRARIAGLILMVPLPLLLGIFILVNKLILLQAISPLTEVPILRWLDLMPAALGLLGSFIYLHFTNPNRNPETLQFWLAATLPAIGLYIAINLFPTLFDLSVRLPLPAALQLDIPDIVIGIVIPVVFVFVVTMIYPVVISWRSALLFAVPVFAIHVYYLVITDWISPGISSIAYPGDTPGAGYQEILNGLVAGLVSLLMLLGVALISLIVSKTRRNLWRTVE